MIVCIDSQAIIWGIKKKPTEGQENMVAKAEYFFQWLDNSGHNVVIPTVVVAEILTPEPEEIRGKYLEVLTKNFIVASFDSRVALKYAEILHGKLDEAKRKASEQGILRQKMKIDHIIIATALVMNSACIYSYDNGLKSFAEGLIDVRHFPEPPVKPKNLFSDLPEILP